MRQVGAPAGLRQLSAYKLTWGKAVTVGLAGLVRPAQPCSGDLVSMAVGIEMFCVLRVLVKNAILDKVRLRSVQGRLGNRPSYRNGAGT